MIVVRNTFQAKPGQAGKLAATIKDAANALELPSFRVMTDLVGEFNTVVFEYDAENLAAFESRMKDYVTNPILREKFKGYTELWDSGKRELFQVV
ncbi:MAG: hypothetical protein FJW38_10775 [Acidobacteria bacterium]|nr:hypothetical protein [Acidobacteriota bacterium]